MKRYFVIVCSLFLLNACSTQHQTFTNRTYLDVPSALINTSWKISYVNDFYGKRTFDIVLVDDGKVACFNPFDTTPNNDEWEEKDGCIYIYFNNREAVYKAILFDDNLLVGNAHSQMGGTWNWIAKKYQ